MNFFLFIVSTVMSYTKAKKAKDAARRAAEDAAGVLVNQETTNAYIPVIYGRRRVGGVKRIIGSVDVLGGDKNEYIYIALLVGEGEINSLSEIEIDDVAITNSKFNGLYSFEYHTGADNQAASALLQEVPGWTANHKFSGMAYVAIRLKWDTNNQVFSQNPNITVIAEGRKVFDPRTSTVAYSTNPALCIRDYKTNARYGKGLISAKIDDASYTAAANDYDQTVEFVTGGGVNGKLHEFNAVIDTGKNLFDNIQLMQTGCRSFLPYSQGKYGLYMDKSRPVSKAFDESNIVGGIKVVGEKKANKYNQVRVTFVNPQDNWQSDTAIWPAKDSAESVEYLAEDGVELIFEIDMPTCTNYYAALDLARVLVVRSRNAKRVVLPVNSEAFALSVPDTVSITHPTPGFAAKPFQIESLGLGSDGECVISAIEYDSAVYAYDNDVEQAIFTDTVLPDPSVVAPVNNLQAVGAVQSESDGGYLSAIDVSFDAPLDSFVESYEITYDGSDGSQEIISIRATTYRQTNLNAGATYTVSVRAVNSAGFRSAAVSVNNVSPSVDDVAPSVPTSASVAGTFKQINLSWINPSDADFRHVEIKRSETNVEADAVYLDRTDSGSYSDSGYSEQVTRYYWLRSVDRTGNASAWVSAGGGTSLALVANDFDAGVIDVAFLTSSLQGTIADKAEQSSLSVLIDEAQSTGDTLDTIAERMLGLAITQSDTLGLVSDAGITVDPATGAVTIQAVEALRTEVDSQINTVSVDLDAAEAEITLKASTVYVNESIASAVLDSADLASLTAIEVKLAQAELEIDGLQGAITGKAEAVTVSDLDIRVSDAEFDINAAEEAIGLKVSSTDFGLLDTRVQTAEQTLTTIDAPSIVQTVIDSRALHNELDFGAINTLQDLLAAYRDRKAIKTDVAFAQNSITAEVSDLRVASATERSELGSLIETANYNINSALQNAATAQEAADGKIVSFYQSSPPAASGIGDLWTDTTGGNNKLYRWSGSAWLSIQDSAIAAAALAASDADVKAASKTTTFFQDAPPTATSAKDLWVDTANNNTLYRWNGSSWVNIQDGTIALAAQAAVDAQQAADGKVVTFYQDNQPTADGDGDLWFDTNDNNRLYRWDASSSEWVDAQDGDIGAALTQIGYKTTSFYQAGTPTAIAAGDLWIDTDDGNKLYAWNGSDWVASQDQAIAEALQAAQGAEETADGKIISFFQDAEPVEASIGDIWFDTNDGNKIYRYNGAVWIEAQDDEIAATIEALDGKITTFYQDEPPTAESDGDLWVDTNDDNRLYRWSGSAWEDIQPQAIAANAGAISQEATTRSTEDQALAATVSTIFAGIGVAGADVYNASTLYRVGEGTIFNGLPYICIAPAQNIAPTNAAYWTEIETTSAAILDNNSSRIGYCIIGGDVTDHKDQADCVAAGGTWNADQAIVTAAKQIKLKQPDGTYATIENQAETVVDEFGNIRSVNGVTIDNNGHVSGYGLVSDIIDGNTTSAFVVAADQFAIGGANNVTGDYPFVHYANATTVTVDGETFTIPAGTYIENAKINYLSANEIITGELSAERIKVDGATIQADGDTLKIKNLGVDTLQIAGNAVTIPRSDTSASDVYLSDGVWTTINDIVFSPASVGGQAQPVSVKAYLSFSVYDSANVASFGTLYVRIRNNSQVVMAAMEVSQLILYPATGFYGGASVTVNVPFGALSGSTSPIYLDTSTSTVQRTYEVQAMWAQAIPGGSGFTIPAGAVLECTEVKR